MIEFNKGTTTPKEVEEMVLYAWVGEDDLGGSGEWGLKRAICPAGVIPMVACKDGKINTPNIVRQMEQMVGFTGKPRYLARFTFSNVVMVRSPDA
jgi:hypothetical protein